MLAQCAADFHGKKERYIKFVEIYREYQPDIVILAGDLGRAEERFFDEMEVPIYVIHGNMDGTLKELKDKVEFIDGRIVEHGKIKFMGIGNVFPENVREKVDVVVSHLPPYRTKDRTFIGTHIGSKWLRTFMEEEKPAYIICGHVHEDPGYEKFGETYVVNCSIGKRGMATFIEFEEEKIEMIGYL